MLQFLFSSIPQPTNMHTHTIIPYPQKDTKLLKGSLYLVLFATLFLKLKLSFVVGIHKVC